jgi:hypothetical protein
MRSSNPLLLLLLLLLLSGESIRVGTDLVRLVAFGVEFALEPVRLVRWKERVPCLRETELLDFVLLVLEGDIMIWWREWNEVELQHSAQRRGNKCTSQKSLLRVVPLHLT